MSAQHVVGDGENVGAKPGRFAEAIARDDARRKRLLNEVFDLGPYLVEKEALDELIVAVKDLLTGLCVAGAPALQELGVTLLHRPKS